MEENNQAAAPTMQAAPEAKMKFCRHCGGKIPEDAVICTLCGRQVEEINQKFYEGKIGMGILYLFTAGFFGIGVLIDFITLLFKPNPYYV